MVYKGSPFLGFLSKKHWTESFYDPFPVFFLIYFYPSSIFLVWTLLLRRTVPLVYFLVPRSFPILNRKKIKIKIHQVTRNFHPLLSICWMRYAIQKLPFPSKQSRENQSKMDLQNCSCFGESILPKFPNQDTYLHMNR